jgi:putative transposase
MPKPDKAFFWRGAHAFHKCCYHLVFVPKYRRRVLQKDVVGRLEHLMIECAKVNRWFIHELEILPDHVHLLLQLPPSVSVAKAVQYLKGGTSRVIRHEHPELEEFLWGDSLWQDGYFAESVGRMDEKTIRAYIQAQWDHNDPNSSPGL